MFLRRLTLTVAAAVAVAGTSVAGIPVASATDSGEQQAAVTETRTIRYQVNSVTDAPDSAPGDGRCRADNGGCTLRAAVMEANATSGSTIVIPAGRYTLSIPPRGVPFTDYTLADAAHGNLKVMAPTTIVGAGLDSTVIDGGRIDRVFTVRRPATISGLTVTGGVATPLAGAESYSAGGGVLNTSELTMERVRVTGNTAGFGGGVFNTPTSSFILRDSLVDLNEAGEAGGIRFDSDGLVERATITRNRVVNPHDPTRPGELAGLGGGIDVRGPGITVVGSRVTDNYAEDGGGGINITLAYVPGPEVPVGPGRVELQDSVVTGNTRAGGPSDCRAVLARIVDLGGNTDSDGSCT
ncbi:CSLREA domain-containing protein [Micromonospora sp. WMMD558]